MQQTLIMRQPLLPFDSDEYRECSGPLPSVLTTCEFRASKPCLHLICGACIELLVPLLPSPMLVPPLLLAGASGQCMEVPAEPGCRYFSIRFAPGIFYWNVPCAPKELFGRILPFPDPQDYAPLLPSNLARFEGLERRTAYFCENVLPCLKKYPTPLPVAHMITRILETEGSLPIARLAEELSYSERHVNRLFLHCLGFGPKLFCKQVRFQSTLEKLTKMPDRKIAPLLAQTGYSDQAHFQREFKEFTGLTPKQYLRRLYG